MVRVRISWKWLGPAIGALVVLGLLGGGWFWQSQLQDAASAGKRAASSGAKALTALDLPTAKQEFATAEQEFTRARGLLGPGWLTSVPWVGRQLAAAGELTEIGALGSSAGGRISDLLDKALHSTTENRFAALAALSASHLEPALGELAEVDRRSQALSSDGLIGPLADAVDQVKELVGSYADVFAAAAPAQDLARYLFGSQHRFVLISQNNGELRPVGGFPGTYGLVTIGPDGFALEKYSGIHRLPNDTLDLKAPEGAYMNKHFRFRDANWWIDFPTSAPVMLKFWENLRQPQVDGIIAIDVITLQDLLTVFGPVTLPGTDEQLTKDNAVRRLTEFVEFDRASYGKLAKAEALIPMVKSMLKKIETVSTDQLKPLLGVLTDLASEKHIQLYATEPSAQSAIVELGIGGAIAPPTDTTDLLVASNAVVCTTKTNLGVSKRLDYTVTLAADGSATTRLDLGFAKTSELYEGLPLQYFCDYLRVYRAPGTTVTSPDAAGGFVDRPEDGRPVFAKYFELQPGKKLTQRLETTVPAAMTLSTDGRQGNYRLLLVRQADLAETNLDAKITAPAGWRFSSGTATWRPGGGPQVQVALDGSTASVSTPLQRDLIVDLELTKG